MLLKIQNTGSTQQTNCAATGTLVVAGEGTTQGRMLHSNQNVLSACLLERQGGTDNPCVFSRHKSDEGGEIAINFRFSRSFHLHSGWYCDYYSYHSSLMHFLGLMIEHDRKPKKCMTWLDTGIFLWTATLEKLVCL